MRTVRVKVANHEQYDDGPFVFQGTLDKVIASLKMIRDSIPTEFRATAACEISSVSGWEDTHYANIEVTYNRPMTPDEEREEQDAAKRRLQAAESADMQQLRVLMAKYGAVNRP